MNTLKVFDAIRGKENLLKKLKIAVCNAHDAYLAEYDVLLSNEFRLFAHNSNCEEEIEQRLRESYKFMGVANASLVLSDVGIRIDKEKIKKEYYQDECEYYNIYPYEAIWDEIKDLSEHDFLIAILSLITNVETYRKLGEFYQSTILRSIKDIGLEDAYNTAFRNNTVFVAMWFDDSMKEVRRKIEQAVRNCGYDSVLIDQKEHNNQIVPEIFYEISNSAFVIADLTGQRPGVYYEAGYAEALNKTVILTCNQNEDRPHFDVAQKNIIFWSSPDDLQSRLYNRIKATCLVV